MIFNKITGKIKKKKALYSFENDMWVIQKNLDMFDIVKLFCH